MIVLALDTCLAACSVALALGDETGRDEARELTTLSWRSEAMARGHQERLASMIGEVMADGGQEFAALDRIGVTLGPGSFTGLRVGLAFAKGLALALDRPCVGVGVLEALAASVEADGPRAAVIDAGRGRVYLQMFQGAAALSGPDILEMELALARLADVYPSGEVALTGPGAPLLLSALPLARLVERAAPDPRIVAALARRAPAVPPRPLYLRPPDAKVKVKAA